MTAKKGQGTIEYLVIIAIVVVIALVVVGLLLQVMQQGNAVPETSAKTAWKSAEPWGIIDWTNDATNGLTLVLRNNSSETLSLNSAQVLTGSGDDISTTDQDNVAAGATILVTYIPLVTNCTAASKYTIPKSGVIINYDSTNISAKTQYGVADIVGTCQ